MAQAGHLRGLGIPLFAMAFFAASWPAVSGEPDLTADASCTEDAMLVLDASGSMVQTDTTGETLLNGAREAARVVIPAASRHRNMGLLTLGPGPGDQCSNVELKVAVQPEAGGQIVREVDKLPADGGTPLSRAVEAAANALHYRSRSAVMVVVSDGDETCGRDPCELARQLEQSAADLTIHVIGFGSDAAASAASCLASETKGRSVRAHDAAELAVALRETLTCPQVSHATSAGIMGNIGRSKFR